MTDKLLIHKARGDEEADLCVEFAELMEISETSAQLEGLAEAQRRYLYCRHCGYFRWVAPP